MSKKWKVILTVIASVVLVTLIGGSVALADNSQQSTNSNPYLAAVATKLGVTEQALTDAMKQAHKDMASAAVNNALANAVTKGVISQAESDALKAWLAQQPAPGDKEAMKQWWSKRPQLSNPKVYNGIIWKRDIIRLYGWCTGNLGINNDDFITKVAANLSKDPAAVKNAFQSAAMDMKSTALQKSLDNAVKNGKITQDEANQIQSWWNSRPAALNKVAPGFGWFGIRGAMRHMMGRPGINNSGNTTTTTN